MSIILCSAVWRRDLRVSASGCALLKRQEKVRQKITGNEKQAPESKHSRTCPLTRNARSLAVQLCSARGKAANNAQKQTRDDVTHLISVHPLSLFSLESGDRCQKAPGATLTRAPFLNAAPRESGAFSAATSPVRRESRRPFVERSELDFSAASDASARRKGSAT